MKPRSAIVAALVFAAATGFIGAWRFACQAARAAGETATLRRQREQLDREADGMMARLRRAEAERAKVQSDLDQLQRAKPAPQVRRAAPPPPSPRDLIANDPQLQLKSRAAQRVGITRQFGPLFRTLALTPAQIQQFTELVTRRTEAQQDLDAVRRERGLEKGAPEIVALEKNAAEEFERDQTALLGSEGYAAFRDYERTLELRAIVGQFAGASAISGVPLDPGQAERLVGLLGQSAADSPVAGAASGTIRAGMIDWAKADMQAAQVLSPEQLALFQTIEPIGGGPSRWWARLDQEMAAAKKNSDADTNRALNALGKKGPNG